MAKADLSIIGKRFDDVIIEEWSDKKGGKLSSKNAVQIRLNVFKCT